MPVYDYDNIINALKTAKKIWIVGDGGSAALADHLACDLLKNAHLPAISLCSNSALITAIANDYSFSKVFSMQLKELWSKDDILIILSTSGNSENLISGFKEVDKSILIVGGGYLLNNKRQEDIVIHIEGKDQMDTEDCILQVCHEIARRSMK